METRKSINRRNPHDCSSQRQVSVVQLMAMGNLKMSAPQTAPKGGTKRRLISHPYTLVQVAWVVAEVHRSAVSIVLNQTAQNVRRIFGLEDPAP